MPLINIIAGVSWHPISSIGVRAGHAAVYVDSEDALFIYGGRNLTDVKGDMLEFKFETNKWRHYDRHRRGFRDGVESISSELGFGPPALYLHAMVAVPNGVVVYGGLNGLGGAAGEIWLFNLTQRVWRSPRVENALPSIFGHTLTLADNGFIYCVGRDTFLRLDIGLTSWTKLPVRGLGASAMPTRGHTTVFYKADRSLVVYGGLRMGTELSSKMLIYSLSSGTWSELRGSGRSPPSRAFHTSTLMGDFLVTFGGIGRQGRSESEFTRTYFYHVGCHVWITGGEEDFIQHAPDGYNSFSGKHDLYGHAASVRSGSQMFIVGGFGGGTATGDVFAYTLPAAQVLANSSALCGHYTTRVHCLGNPVCGFCPSDGTCRSREEAGECSGANLLTGAQCPGLCQALADCRSCVSMGCSWCSEGRKCSDARHAPRVCAKLIVADKDCLMKNEEFGLTLFQYDSPSSKYVHYSFNTSACLASCFAADSLNR